MWGGGGITNLATPKREPVCEEEGLKDKSFAGTLAT